MLSEKANRCIINTIKDDTAVLLTIAIPTFKRFDLLKETLRSVFANNFKIKVEVIIVDNDPEDETIALDEMKEFKNYSFKYYKNQENYGMFGNWNQCLSLANGKYITILHDDDLLDINFAPALEEEICKGYNGFSFDWYTLDQRKSQNLPSFNFLHYLSKYTLKLLKRFRKRNIYDLQDFFVMNRFMGTLGVIFERKKALELNGFDEKYYPIADYEFWMRWIIDFGELKFVPKQMTYYRIRQNESMKPEVISLFISMNDSLRHRIVDNKKISAPKSLLQALKERDTFQFNFNWQSRAELKKITFQVICYLYIRFKCVLLSYFLLKKC